MGLTLASLSGTGSGEELLSRVTQKLRIFPPHANSEQTEKEIQLFSVARLHFWRFLWLCFRTVGEKSHPQSVFINTRTDLLGFKHWGLHLKPPLFEADRSSMLASPAGTSQLRRFDKVLAQKQTFVDPQTHYYQSEPASRCTCVKLRLQKKSTQIKNLLCKQLEEAWRSWIPPLIWLMLAWRIWKH